MLSSASTDRVPAALHNEPSWLRANVVDRRLPDHSALAPGIVDVAADRNAGLVLTDGITKRSTAGVATVFLSIGNAVGRRVRNQHRARGT